MVLSDHEQRYVAFELDIIDCYSDEVVKRCNSIDEAITYSLRYNNGTDSPKREETADDSGWTENLFGYNYSDWN